MSEVFISYAHEDQPFVRQLVAGLEGSGLSVWWDHTIPPGKTWDEVIARGIQEAKACIIIWSPHSIGSDWVKEEATLAKDGRKYLPVQIGAEPPMGFRRIQAANLSDWDGDTDNAQYRMLVREATTLARGTAPPAATPAPAPVRSAPIRPAPAPDPAPAAKSKAGLVIGLAIAALVVIGGGLWLSNQNDKSDLTLAQQAQIDRLRAERDQAMADRDANTAAPPRPQEAAPAPQEQRTMAQRPAAPPAPASSTDWALQPNVVYVGAIARRNAGGAMQERPYEVSFDPGLSSAKVTVRDAGTVRVVLALRGSWNGDTFTGTTARISGAEWTTDAVTIVKQPGGMLKWTHADGEVTGTGTLRPR
jgi:hypothetical protein